jgi:two-component system, LytTR family, response regulator
MKKFRAIIVDDEPFARVGLKRALGRHEDVELVAECANGLEAVQAIEELRPELVLLDLQMPELDGFGVIEAVGVEKIPALVFTTAYDQFALKAFAAHALDYVLKPFDDERIDKALERAKRQIKKESLDNLSERLAALLEQPRRDKYLERIVIKNSGRIFFLNVEEIDWIEAADNYVQLHVARESHLVHGTLSKLEGSLNPEKFVRVHRSTIMNLARVKEIRPLFHGEYSILLHDGTELTSSRTYRDRLEGLLANSF